MSTKPQREAVFEQLAELTPVFGQRAAAIDSERRFPTENIDDLRSRGLLGLTVPSSVGGLGGGITDDFPLMFEAAMTIAAACTNTAQSVGVHFTSGCIMSLLGNDEQQKRYFAKMLDDGILYAMWASEPGTGPIRVKLTTTAKRVDGGYVISGMKHYATNSLGADWILLFVQREQMSLADGMILAAIPTDHPGVVIHDNWNAMGQRGTASGSAEFNEVFVPDADIIASEAEFFKPKIIGSMFQSLFSAIYVGAAEGALAVAADYLATRGRPSPGYDRRIDDPILQHQIGELGARVYAARLAVLDAVRQLHGVYQGTVDFPVASLAAAKAGVVSTQVATDVVNDVFRLVGSSAARRDGEKSSELELFLRNIRLLSLQGSIDDKRALIGRSMLGVAQPTPTLSS